MIWDIFPASSKSDHDMSSKIKYTCRNTGLSLTAPLYSPIILLWNLTYGAEHLFSLWPVRSRPPKASSCSLGSRKINCINRNRLNYNASHPSENLCHYIKKGVKLGKCQRCSWKTVADKGPGGDKGGSWVGCFTCEEVVKEHLENFIITSHSDGHFVKFQYVFLLFF